MSATGCVGSSGSFGTVGAPLFQASRFEIAIDADAQSVWSVLTDLSYQTVKSWNPQVVSVRHVSGEPGKQNELVLITKDVSAAQAAFYMRTIRIVPNYHRVVRIDAVDCSFGAFVDHSLYESNSKTTLTYTGYIETRLVPMERVQTFDYQAATEEMMGYLKHGHELLKKIVEERSQASSL